MNQSQNAEIRDLNDQRFYVDEEERPQRILVHVVKSFGEERAIRGGIALQPASNRVCRRDHGRRRSNYSCDPQKFCGRFQRKLDDEGRSCAPSRTFATTSVQDTRFPSRLARLRARSISASVGGRRTRPIVWPVASTSSIGPSLARIRAATSSATATFVMKRILLNRYSTRKIAAAVIAPMPVLGRPLRGAGLANRGE